MLHVWGEGGRGEGGGGEEERGGQAESRQQEHRDAACMSDCQKGGGVRGRGRGSQPGASESLARGL